MAGSSGSGSGSAWLASLNLHLVFRLRCAAQPDNRLDCYCNGVSCVKNFEWNCLPFVQV